MDNVTSSATAMTAAQTDSGNLTEQAREKVTLLEDLYIDPKQIMTNDNRMIGELKEMFIWCGQMVSADTMTLPEDVKVMGYNPNTGDVLKADDPENCLEYRKQYVRRLVQSFTQKVINLMDRDVPSSTIETMSPATLSALKDLAAEAQKVMEQASAK